MGNLFTSCDNGSKIKTASITDHDKAVLRLKTQRKKLQDQQKLLEARIDRNQEVASALLKEKKRDRALLALKKKKLNEKQLQQLGQLLLNTEDMINNIEMSKHQNKIFDVLQEGNQVLKDLQAKVSVEDVQRLMDDTAEAKAYQDELNAVLGQSLTDADDVAVAAELNELEALMLAGEVAEMPSVPVTQPVAVATSSSVGDKASGAAVAAEQVELEAAGKKVAMLAS